jgi:hypothetical protein
VSRLSNRLLPTAAAISLSFLSNMVVVGPCGLSTFFTSFLTL